MTDSALRAPKDAASARTRTRNPLLWLVVGIPLATVPAGLVTVYVAFRHADREVADEVRRDGLAINVDPARDRQASTLGLAAQLSAPAGRLEVTLSGAHPSRLVVVLSHATRADVDRMLTLDATADGRYGAALAPLEAGHWYVELNPPDRQWRLLGDFRAPLTTLAVHARSGP